MKHIAKFNASTDVQSALDTGTLENPYVAKVGTGLDYNTLEPASVVYKGEWSDDLEGHYTFTIDPDPTKWADECTIATFTGYFDGAGPLTIEVKFTGGTFWQFNFGEESASETEDFRFDDNTPSSSQTEITVLDLDSSGAHINVDWDGTNAFSFSCEDPDFPLSMNTVNIVDE